MSAPPRRAEPNCLAPALLLRRPRRVMLRRDLPLADRKAKHRGPSISALAPGRQGAIAAFGAGACGLSIRIVDPAGERLAACVVDGRCAFGE